jgi:hypothetical protein
MTRPVLEQFFGMATFWNLKNSMVGPNFNRLKKLSSTLIQLLPVIIGHLGRWIWNGGIYCPGCTSTDLDQLKKIEVVMGS